jgi:hypothetical protein
MHTLIPNLMVHNLGYQDPGDCSQSLSRLPGADILKKLGAEAPAIRRAWIFMLLCPFVLYFGPAWGQFDVIVALLTLLSLVYLDRGKLLGSAVLLALAIAFKPIALPVFPVAILYLVGKPSRQAFQYVLWFSVSLVLFCTLPFLLLGWDVSPILRGWNAHFTVGGAMSFVTYYELLKDTYQLPGGWWLLSLAWIPATGIAVYALRRGISGFTDLIRSSLG